MALVLPLDKVIISEHCRNLLIEEIDFLNVFELFTYPTPGVCVISSEGMMHRYIQATADKLLNESIIQKLEPVLVCGHPLPGHWIYTCKDKYGLMVGEVGSLEQCFTKMMEDLI